MKLIAATTMLAALSSTSAVVANTETQLRGRGGHQYCFEKLGDGFCRARDALGNLYVGDYTKYSDYSQEYCKDTCKTNHRCKAYEWYVDGHGKQWCEIHYATPVAVHPSAHVDGLVCVLKKRTCHTERPTHSPTTAYPTHAPTYRPTEPKCIKTLGYGFCRTVDSSHYQLGTGNYHQYTHYNEHQCEAACESNHRCTGYEYVVKQNGHRVCEIHYDKIEAVRRAYNVRHAICKIVTHECDAHYQY